jgi:hypothetical protein
MTDQKPEKPNEPDWRYVMAREEARRAHDRATSFATLVNEATIKTGESTFQPFLALGQNPLSGHSQAASRSMDSDRQAGGFWLAMTKT